jgi:hypothetical protein
VLGALHSADSARGEPVPSGANPPDGTRFVANGSRASHRQNRTFLPPPEYNPLAPTSDPASPTELPAGQYDAAVFENLFRLCRPPPTSR